MNKKLKRYIRTKFNEKDSLRIEAIYDKEYARMLKKEKKVLSKNQYGRAKRQILNRIAMYKAFRKYLDVEKAGQYSYQFMKRDMVWFKNLTNFMTAGKFRTNLYKKIFARALKSDVWDKEILKHDKTGLDFNMTRCLYSDLCYKYGVPEFAPIFCKGDYFVFGEMKRLEFSRNQTLGEGGEVCDFHYTNK